MSSTRNLAVRDRSNQEADTFTVSRQRWTRTQQCVEAALKGRHAEAYRLAKEVRELERKEFVKGSVG